MSLTDAFTSRRVLLAVCLLMGLGLSGVVMASRPEAQSKAPSCDPVDAGLLAQIRPTQGPQTHRSGAADHVMTLVLAARRLCENGDIKGAQAMYRRADAALSRFQPARNNDESDRD